MKRLQVRNKTSFKHNKGYVGETIEQKVRRIANNKEPITDGAPMVYTDREEGVLPHMDIRTDKFELANDHTDNMAKTARAKREERLGEKAKKNMETEKKNETPASGSAGTEGKA